MQTGPTVVDVERAVGEDGNQSMARVRPRQLSSVSVRIGETPDSHAIAALQQQARRTVRRLKRAMSYHGSQSTDDFVHVLVLKWLKSGELNRLLSLPPERRQLATSVRGAIVDRFRYREANKRDGVRVDLERLSIPSVERIYDIIENQLLREWVEFEIGLLEEGYIDTELNVRLTEPRQTGRALRCHCRGWGQRRIADTLHVSLSTVHRRLRAGIMYLSLRMRWAEPASLRRLVEARQSCEWTA